MEKIAIIKARETNITCLKCNNNLYSGIIIYKNSEKMEGYACIKCNNLQKAGE